VHIKPPVRQEIPRPANRIEPAMPGVAPYVTRGATFVIPFESGRVRNDVDRSNVVTRRFRRVADFDGYQIHRWIHRVNALAQCS
jgi:hypothetical protein